MFSRSLALLLLGAATACSAQTPTAEPYKAGTDYLLIEPAQPTSSGDKIEVLEIFGYSCNHCASFQPKIDSWKKTLPEYASFQYMPAVFGGIWETFARAFYTAETMGLLEKSHNEMFNAVHVARSVQSEAGISKFYEQFGVSEADFAATMNSFAVNAKVARAQQLVPRYGVSGTPTMVVNGKYRVEASTVNSHERMLAVVDYLIEKEHAAAAP